MSWPAAQNGRGTKERVQFNKSEMAEIRRRNEAEDQAGEDRN